MKVLFYAPFPKGRFPGGITFIAESLRKNSNYLIKSGIHISFINSSPIFRKNESMGRIRIENITNFFEVRNLLNKLLSVNSYDILHLNTSVKLALLKDLILIKQVRKIFTGRIILHIHYADISKILFQNRFLNKIVMNLIIKNIDHLLLLSETLKQEFTSQGFNGTGISVLYNFHLMPRFSAFPEKNKNQLLYLGSIDNRKGFADLLEALSKLKDLPYKLKVGGTFLNSKLKKVILNEINKKNLNVEFLGYIQGEQKIRVIKESSILILPSYGEGLPVVILEAMAGGCALITSGAGSITEVIKKNVNGLIINPGDAENLALKISQLLRDEILLHNIQLNNLRESARYSFNNYCNNLKNVYNNNNSII